MSQELAQRKAQTANGEHHLFRLYQKAVSLIPDNTQSLHHHRQKQNHQSTRRPPLPCSPHQHRPGLYAPPGGGLNLATSNGTLSPIQMARWVWFRNSRSASGTPSSVVFGWTKTESGPRQMASQGMKAPNWAGVNRFTSNMATGCGPIGRSQNLYIRSSGNSRRMRSQSWRAYWDSDEREREKGC